MAHGQFLSETVARDKRLNGLSLEAEYVFLKSIPHLDRDGRITGDPDVLFGQVCPKRPRLQSRMELYIKEWVEAGLCERYTYGEDDVLFFCGFAKNQIGLRYDREAPSKFLPPPSATLVVEEVGSSDGASPDEVRSNSGVVPDELRSSDGASPEEIPLLINKLELIRTNEKEGEGEGVAAVPPPAPTEAPRRILRSKNGNHGTVIDFKSPHVDNSRFDLTTCYIPAGAGLSAVEVYYERFDVTSNEERLTGPHEDDLVRACPDLALLREVVTAYHQSGYERKRNIKLILDWYREPARFRTKDKPAAPSGRMSPADKTQANAAELRVMLMAQGKESLLHG